MKKVFLSLVISLFGAIGVMAQASHPWTPATNEDYESEMVVYAGIVDEYGPMWVWDTYIAAFIDGECRAVTEVAYAPDQTCYFPMRIAGAAADAGKNIEFKIWMDNLTYSMTETLTYVPEGTEGTLSDLFLFTMNCPRYYMLTPQVELTVGDVVDLSDYVEWVETTNPTLPDSLPWIVPSQEYVTLKGNQLTAVAPTDNNPVEILLDMPNCKSYDGNYSILVTVKRPEVPIQSITILDEYVGGVLVNVGDYETMTTILSSCYTLNPENTTEVPVWSCSDPEAIVASQAISHVGQIWTPVKPGEYVMTLMAQNCSATLHVRVYQPVQGISSDVKYLGVRVGDNIDELLKKACHVYPEDASNPLLLVSQTGVSDYVSWDGYALQPGEFNVMVMSDDNRSITITIPVIVHQDYTITAVEDELVFTLQPGDASRTIKYEVLNNLQFSPDVPEPNIMANGYDLNSDNENVVRMDTSIYLTGLGIAHIEAYHYYYYHVWDEATESIQEVQALNSCTFTVRGAKGVEVLTASIQSATIGDDQPFVITLTPEPEDAYFLPEDVYVFVRQNQTDGFPSNNWELATIEYDQDNDYLLTPKSIGSGTVYFMYDGVTETVSLNIGQTVHPQVGWKWISLYSGSIDLESIQMNYGQYLEEIRSQSALLANDPQYGYFGDLNEMNAATAYKVKLYKECADYVIPFSSQSRSHTALLKKSWTWLGNPYQYDHALADLFDASELTAGDRIVSKNGGFAEYSGTKWTGTLTTLENGIAYLYYNKKNTAKSLTFPSEVGMPQGSPALHAPDRQQSSVWQYDESQWADNMSIIAVVDGIDLSQGSYTVGAMVDGECRGEGQVVDGYLFITVHGKSGEQITFCLYDADTDSYIALENRLQLGMMAGSLDEPVQMQAAETNGIQLNQIDAAGHQVYDLYGRRIKGNDRPAGFYIVK